MESTVPPQLADKLATIREAAQLVSRSTRQVQRMLKSGELTPFRYGKYTHITKASIEAYLNEIAAAIP